MQEVEVVPSVVATVLTELASGSATGCLVVRDDSSAEAEVYLRDGQVYAVSVPGRRPRLGARLMSSMRSPPRR